MTGLLVCSGCGKPMQGRTDRMEYYCSTWDHHRVDGDLKGSPCLRNGIKQEVLEDYVGRYLEETDKRLDLLIQRPDGEHLTDKLEGQQSEAWRGLCEGIDRLTAYLAQHHPAEFAAIEEWDKARRAEERAEELASRHSPTTPSGVLDRFGDSPSEAIEEAVGRPISVMPSDPYVGACLDAYKSNFDPAAVDAEIERLESEHDALMGLWADLPTPRAKEKAKERFTELEARIEELKRQREDVVGLVERYCRDIYDLQATIAEAKRAMRSETGERALRQRAEALRGLLCRIDCEFILTGRGAPRRGGPGQARSSLGGGPHLPSHRRGQPAVQSGGTSIREAVVAAHAEARPARLSECGQGSLGRRLRGSPYGRR